MTTVTVTVGTNSRQYSTITLAEADATAVASGNIYVIDCYNDSVFNEAVTINDTGPTYIQVTVHAGQRHTGVAGTGARIVYTGASDPIIALQANAGSSVEWLEIVENSASDIRSLLTLNNRDLYWKNLIVHGLTNSQNTTMSGLSVAHFGTSGGNLAAAINCIVYDCNNASAGGSAQCVGIANASSRGGRVLNCTIHDITVSGGGGGGGNGHASNTASVVQNTISTGNTTAAFTGTPATEDHNLSSDTTASGTGSLTSKTAANQYVSTTVGSEDLHLKAGADAIGAGVDLVTTPTGVQFDIDGSDRDTLGVVWDIGADQTTVTDYALTATGITSSPTVGTPAITQVHALTATGITSSPTMGSPALTQTHALTAAGVTSSPVVGTPAVSQDHALTAAGVTSSPSVGSPTLTQDHALVATGIASTPVVGTPAVAQVHALVAADITSSPTVGSPVLADTGPATPLVISDDRTIALSAESRIVVLAAESRTIAA